MGIAFPFKPCNSHRNLLAWRRTPQQIDQTCGERLQGHPRGAAPSVGAQLARVRRVLAWGAWELHSHSNPAAPFAIGSTGVDPQRKSTKPAAGAAAGAPEGRGTLGRSAARKGSQGLSMGSMGIAFPFKPCSPLCDWFDRRRSPTQIDQTCGGTMRPRPPAGEKALRRRKSPPQEKRGSRGQRPLVFCVSQQ